MTSARTIAAVAIATITLVLVPQVQDVETSTESRIETVVLEPVEPLEEVVVEDIIDGIRIRSDNPEIIALATAAAEKYAAIGYPITNTEIQYDPNACTNAVGYHAYEDGHHLVMLCKINEWTLLHELGHVWSDQYLDEHDQDHWLEHQELDSWSEGEWKDRGTERAADVMAYGLYDDVNVPTSVGIYDLRTANEAYEWLTGLSPNHRQRRTEVTTGHETTARVQVVASRTITPVEAPTTEEELAQLKAVVEYQFPIACGYPRWHSSHGGYGYTDPRDWTHVGVDIYAYEGTPVVSPVHGTVVDAGWNDISGWKVVVEDRYGYSHRMVHLSGAPEVVEGMTVTAGQKLGEVGRSGNAEGGGPHLHYEIRSNGETVNPMPWLLATGEGHIEAAPASFYTTEAPEWSDCANRA